MRLYCQCRKRIEEIKEKTADRRGELKRTVSELRGVLLQFLDNQECDIIVVNDKMAIKRCVCVSFGRLRSDTITDAFQDIYIWERLQPKLASGESLPVAVRQLLKEEVTLRTRRVRQYGDVVNIASAKYRSRVSLSQDARREKRLSRLPAEVAGVVDDLLRCVEQQQQLKEEEKAQLQIMQTTLKQLEPCIMESLKRTETGRSTEFELGARPPAIDAPSNAPYTSLPPPDFLQSPLCASRSQTNGQVVDRVRVRYKKRLQRPVVSVAKMDLSVGNDLQRYFEETVCGGSTARCIHDLPRVSLSSIQALVDQSLNHLIQENVTERECLSVETRRTEVS